ncbi:uncharacterized protein LOC135705118 [Ochlerotatus camptorhynchus]|uniref:uncharacterized protein LOC135705118 n=1 Tax=Ochlerotatus camptorhynchus TaxID=644619 RepID=UPI0031DDBC29
MKFFLAFVGIVCLMGGIHAQTGYITDTVSSAVSISNANLASTIQRVNGTIVAADQIILASWTQLGQDLIDLYNSYYNQFNAYTTIDLSPITSAISNVQSMMTTKPQLLEDDTYYVQETFTEAQTSAQQIQYSLTAAAVNMTSACESVCDNRYVGKCAKKYAGQLSTAPISVDRVTDCIAAEETRFANIGADVASQYSNALPMAMNYLLLVNMCDIPSPAVLNNPSTTMGPPSNQCFTNYLQQFSSIPTYFYSADFTRMAQTQLVSFRAKRCARLVALDIQDRINQVVDKFYNCLNTGVCCSSQPAAKGKRSKKRKNNRGQSDCTISRDDATATNGSDVGYFGDVTDISTAKVNLPPLVVKNALLNDLIADLASLGVKAEFKLGRVGTKVMLRTKAEYDLVVTHLRAFKVEFFTHDPFNVVIKGLPIFDPKLIEVDIKNRYKLVPTAVFRMTRRDENVKRHPDCLFLVHFQKGTCVVDESETAECANCDGAHQGSDKQCSKREDFKRIRKQASSRNQLGRKNDNTPAFRVEDFPRLPATQHGQANPRVQSGPRQETSGASAGQSSPSPLDSGDNHQHKTSIPISSLRIS